MSNILSSILNAIKDIIIAPIEAILFDTLIYQVIFKGALKALYAFETILNSMLGSSVEKVLFHTTFVDGNINYNFFASTSPLKTIFLICLGVASSLLMITLSLKIVTAFNRNSGKAQAVKKLTTLLASSSFVFILPTIFITLLSLSSTFIRLMTGDNVSMGNKDIDNWKTSTNLRVQTLRELDGKNYLNFNKKINSSLFYKEDGSFAKKGSLSIEDIYNNLINVADKDENTLLKNHAINSKEMLKTIKTTLLNFKFKTQLENWEAVLSRLTPRYQNDSDAKIIKEFNYNISNLNKKIQDYSRHLTKNILKTKSINPNEYKKVDWNIQNVENLFYSYVFGHQDQIKSVSETEDLNSLSKVAFQINTIKEGTFGSSGNNTTIGSIYLSKILSSNTNSSLTVSFYQLATGSTDTDWENSTYNESDQKTGLILLGFILILAVCYILIFALFHAVIRIFNLALLFVVSPFPIYLSVMDNGERVKMWVRAVTKDLIGIFGIIISLRLVYPIADAFKTMISNDKIFFAGSSGSFMATLLIALFYLAAMIAAYKSTIVISSIFGVSDGMLDTMLNSQVLGGVNSYGKGIGKTISTSGKHSGQIAKWSGLGRHRRGYDNKSVSNSFFAPLSLKGRQDIKESWRKRTKNLAIVSRGKIGPAEAKLRVIKKRGIAKDIKLRRKEDLKQKKMQSLEEKKASNKNQNPKQNAWNKFKSRVLFSNRSNNSEDYLKKYKKTEQKQPKAKKIKAKKAKKIVDKKINTEKNMEMELKNNKKKARDSYQRSRTISLPTTREENDTIDN